MLLFLEGVATSEVFVIFLFVLVFFGAKSIPGLSRSLGRGFRQIKDASQEIQSEISKSTEGMRKDLNLEGRTRQVHDTIAKPLDQVQKEIEKGIEGSIAHKTPPRKYVPPTPPTAEDNLKENLPIDQQDIDTTPNQNNKEA